MIDVTLVTNNGDGMPIKLSVEEGTTVEQLLLKHFDGDLTEYTIRVRSNGLSQEAHEDYILKNGDRISLAPSKIDGAA